MPRLVRARVGDVDARPDSPVPYVAAIMAELVARDLTVAVAESLTGGLLVAELVRPPGASAAVLGGIVAYSTQLKHTLLGVDAELLEKRGPIDPEVARQMADGVRTALAVDGRPAHIGLATTGVAGPDPQGGNEPGTVYLGLAMGEQSGSRRLQLSGTRDQVRAAVVTEALSWLGEALEDGALHSTGSAARE